MQTYATAIGAELSMGLSDLILIVRAVDLVRTYAYVNSDF